jgi:hypothetical protein
MTAPHRVDADVEKIVGRLSLEPTASAARWQVEIHFDSEGRIVWAHRRFASECGIEPKEQPGACVIAIHMRRLASVTSGRPIRKTME